MIDKTQYRRHSQLCTFMTPIRRILTHLICPVILRSVFRDEESLVVFNSSRNSSFITEKRPIRRRTSDDFQCSPLQTLNHLFRNLHPDRDSHTAQAGGCVYGRFDLFDDRLLGLCHPHDAAPFLFYTPL